MGVVWRTPTGDLMPPAAPGLPRSVRYKVIPGPDPGSMGRQVEAGPHGLFHQSLVSRMRGNDYGRDSRGRPL